MIRGGNEIGKLEMVIGERLLLEVMIQFREHGYGSE